MRGMDRSISNSETGPEHQPPLPVDRPPLSAGLINSLALMLTGAAIAVFWRELLRLVSGVIAYIT